MYCAIIIRACPDYKRPYANTSVKHFISKEEAETYVKNSKLEYFRIKDWFRYKLFLSI